MKKSQLARLRVIGLAEGTSFLLLLFVAMPLKYGLGHHEPVRILGSIHGGLFVLYALAVVLTALSLRWAWKRTFAGLICAVVPFGPFLFDASLRREMDEFAAENLAPELELELRN